MDDAVGLAAARGSSRRCSSHPCCWRGLSGTGVVRDLLQHLLRRHARALGVVHAGAHAAGGGLVDVVAAGADRRRVVGMLLLGERPGPSECIALVLVLGIALCGAVRAGDQAGRPSGVSLPAQTPSGRRATSARGSASAPSCRRTDASRFALHRSPIACRVHALRLPTCGSSTTLSIVISAAGICGSFGKDVESGRLDLPAFSAATSAARRRSSRARC